MTHEPDEPCPFANDKFPIGMLGSCCSLRGKVAARELEALGETDLANAMFNDMTDDEAGSFAEDLRSAADRLERDHHADPKLQGAEWNEFDGTKVTPVHTPFEKAIATIRAAARWYQKVSEMGCGVHAWF